MFGFLSWIELSINEINLILNSWFEYVANWIHYYIKTLVPTIKLTSTICYSKDQFLHSLLLIKLS